MARYPEDLDRWRRAGRIGAEARELGARLAVPGASRREVAEAIEGYIRSQGAEPSFPANLSRNDEAAHYTPSPDDDATLAEGDVLKIDVGAHLDGAISDTAMTVEVGGGHRFERLIRASREGLEAGIARVRPGVSVDDIGRAVERAVHALGFKPVENLTGHTIERYLLHAGISAPGTPAWRRSGSGTAPSRSRPGGSTNRSEPPYGPLGGPSKCTRCSWSRPVGPSHSPSTRY